MKKNNSLFYFFITFIIIAIFWWFYFKPLENNFPFFGETYSDYYFYSSQLQKGNLPLWNPYLKGGFSLLGSLEFPLLNPLNLIIAKTISFPLNIKIIYLLFLEWTAIGFLIYLKEKKFSNFISLTGALFFIFSGPFLSFLNNLSLIESISFLPWILLITEKISPNSKIISRKIFLLSFLLSFQILSGPLYIPFLTFLTIFLFSILNLIFLKGSSRELISVFKFMLSLAIITFIFSSIRILPFFALKEITIQNLKYFYLHSLKPTILLSLITLKKQDNFSFHLGLTSILILTFSLFIAVKKRRKFPIDFLIFLIFSSFFFFLTIPAYSPFNIFYLFSPFNLFKSPEEFSLFAVFFLIPIVLSTLSFFKKLQVFIAVIILAESTLFAIINRPPFQLWTNQQIRETSEKYSEIINQIKTQPGKVWFLPSQKKKEATTYLFTSNYNQIWEIPTISLINPKTPAEKAATDLIYNGIDWDEEKNILEVDLVSQKILSLLGVRFIVSDIKTNLEKAQENQGIILYKIPVFCPKETIDNPRIISKEEEIKEWLLSPQECKTVILFNRENISSFDKITIFPFRYARGWIIKNNYSKNLFLTPANFNQIAVIYPKENAVPEVHYSDLAYFPKELKMGAIISLSGIVLAWFFCLFLI